VEMSRRGRHLSGPPARGEVASKSKPSPSPKMSSRTFTDPGTMGTWNCQRRGGAGGVVMGQRGVRRGEKQAPPCDGPACGAFHPL
jgi:hypothetical protein